MPVSADCDQGHEENRNCCYAYALSSAIAALKGKPRQEYFGVVKSANGAHTRAEAERETGWNVLRIALEVQNALGFTASAATRVSDVIRFFEEGCQVTLSFPFACQIAFEEFFREHPRGAFIHCRLTSPHSYVIL